VPEVPLRSRQSIGRAEFPPGRRETQLSVSYLVFVVAAVFVSLPLDAQTTASRSDSVVAPIGSYDDLRSTSEHVYGHSITVWTQGNRVLGWIEEIAGLPGTSDVAIVEKGTLDQTTHRLKCEATMGTITYVFNGTLNGNRIDGELVEENSYLRNTPVGPISRQTLHLTRNPQESERMEKYASYDDWRVVAEKKLRRGAY